MRSILFEIPLPGFLADLGFASSIPIFGYGMMILIAFLVCTWLAGRRAMAYGVSRDAVQDIMTMSLLAGLAGSRLFHILLYPENYEVFVEYFKIWEGGLVLYGAFVTTPPMIWYKLKKHKVSWDVFLRIFIPVIPLGIGIGRLGCFLNGCCYGKPGNMPWCVVFPEGSLPDQALHGYALHPSQLYAFAMGTLLSLFLMGLDRKMKGLPGRILLSLFMLTYGAIRLIEESFRADTPRHFFDTFTAGQAISLLLVCLSPIIYFATRPRNP